MFQIIVEEYYINCNDLVVAIKKFTYILQDTHNKTLNNRLEENRDHTKRKKKTVAYSWSLFPQHKYFIHTKQIFFILTVSQILEFLFQNTT